MLMRTIEKATQLPLLLHVPAAIASVFWLQWAKTKLDASYAASRHPVDFVTGQTTFSGPEIKGYYDAMTQTQTLDIYVRTQLIDFGFILGVALLGIFVCTLFARLARPASWARRIGLIAGLAFVFGAVSDAIENGWSFIMLMNPSGFADWLALPYSSFAMLKFALMTLAMVLTLICVVCALGGRVLGRPKIG